jgi:branched-subunit amino acid aminotransferase/4-amino-4-deoxychorismate lyase
VWSNGRILPESEATVSAADRGFIYGDGLFETLRTRGRSVFRLPQHLERLERGARIIDLTVPRGIDAAVRHLLDDSPLDAGALRITITRGIGAGGLRPAASQAPTLMMSLRPAPPFEVERPLSVAVSPVRICSHSPLAGLKTLGYLINLVALLRTDAEDAVMLDEQGRLAEGTSSNLFWVTEGGEIRTPSPPCGIRRGVTREAVIELARTRGVTVREGEWDLGELTGAREAFATSSLRGIAPIGSLDATPIGDGRAGELTRWLMDEYRLLFERETNRH